MVTLFKNNFIELQFTHHTVYPFKMSNSLVYSIFTEMCNPLCNPFTAFSSPPK